MSKYIGTRCPVCKGELHTVECEEQGKIDIEINGCQPKEIEKLTIGLTFNEEGFASTNTFGWDGQKESMPEEWKGKGYYVIANYHLVESRSNHENIIYGFVKPNHRGIYGATFSSSVKESYSPTIFSSYGSALKFLDSFFNRINGDWFGIKRLVENVISREHFIRSLKIYEILKEFEIIPIEDYLPRKRIDVLNGWKSISRNDEEIVKVIKETKKVVKELDEEDEEYEKLLKNPPTPEEIRAYQNRLIARANNGSDFVFLKEDCNSKSDTESKRKYNNICKYAGRIAKDVSSCRCEGRPLELKQDWSKVDWDEESRESSKKEIEFLAKEKADNIPNGSKYEKDCWVIQDWNSGKFVRLPTKEEGGDARLVEIDDCTSFERLVDANNVSIGIERMFWNKAYVGWRLHVINYKNG